VREFDPQSQHQFFVDTNSSSARAIWHHPYDDEAFLSSLEAEELERVKREGLSAVVGDGTKVCVEDLIAEESDEEEGQEQTPPPSPGKGDKQRRRPLTCKLKELLTGASHTERQSQRAHRSALEHTLYSLHRILRRAMSDTMTTTHPSLLSRDANRTHMYLEPPGHTFPGVISTRRINPYFTEILYDREYGRKAEKSGRFFRPEGEMYGEGYGAFGCGKFAGGRWDRPEGQYRRCEGKGFGGGLGWPLKRFLRGEEVMELE